MLLALFAAIASVALGAGLGLWRGPNSRAVQPIHTFALVAALVVVLTHLLPDALDELGLIGLGAFALAMVVPSLLERLASRFHRIEDHGCEHESTVGLELGYLGLLAHQVGDGLALGAFTSDGNGHSDIVLAIVAHTVPVAAITALAFKSHKGMRSAVVRSVLLALATVVGIGVTSLVATAHLHEFEPWIAAIAGGLLLHVVAHSWHSDRPQRARNKLLDLVAIAAGLALVWLDGDHGGHGEHHAHGLREGLGDALLDLTYEMAPTLLIGLAIAATVQTLGARIPNRWLSGGSRLSHAARGAITGLPLPICACGILPVAQSLRSRGGAAAAVVAFLVATPALGIETFAVTGRFFGWSFAIVRLLGALVVAIVAAIMVSRALGRSDERKAISVPAVADQAGGSRAAQVLHHFDELLYHTGPWTVVGLVAAAYLQVVIPEDGLSGMSRGGVDIFVVAIVAVPSYVCAASATPLAAVLLAKGMSPGAVLVGLLLGPATNIATVSWLRRTFGAKATKWGIAALVLSSWGVAFLVNGTSLQVSVPEVATIDHDHSAFAYGASILLGALVLRGVWRDGLQTWLASLGQALATGERAHAHHKHHHEAG